MNLSCNPIITNNPKNHSRIFNMYIFFARPLFIGINMSVGIFILEMDKGLIPIGLSIG